MNTGNDSATLAVSRSAAISASSSACTMRASLRQPGACLSSFLSSLRASAPPRLHQHFGGVVFEHRRRRARIERAAGDHQFDADVDVGDAFPAKTRQRENAQRFLDACAFVAADAGGESSAPRAGADRASAANSASRNQSLTAERAHADRVDQPLDARAENLEDMAFVVIGVEIVAPAAVPEGQAAERDQHGIRRIARSCAVG